MHGLLLLRRLAVDDAVPQVSEVLGGAAAAKTQSALTYTHTHTRTHSYIYLLVEEDEPEQRSRHRPLVPAVLEDDDVQNRGQHLGTAAKVV